MTIDLKSMAIAMPEVKGHPNRAEFRGVLTVVDIPSQRSPSGANGHLVMLTREAAEAALPSLLGMAMDYSPTWDRHDVRRKVGVITRAEVVGRNVELGGYLFARDFPDIVEEIAKSGGGLYSERAQASRDAFAGGTVNIGAHARAAGSTVKNRDWKYSLLDAVARLRRLAAAVGQHAETRQNSRARFRPTIRAEAYGAAADGLGMSYEVTGVEVRDIRSQVWTLTRVMFTGAAILRRNKAAYQSTWIELST
jgi:hypothetical protein